MESSSAPALLFGRSQEEGLALLTLANVTKSYGRRRSEVKLTALDRFSLQIDEGEFTAVMGPSGAGKTTLLNIIATIDTPDSGTITFDGAEITQMRGRELAGFRRDNLGFVFQEHNLLDTLTLRENIMLPLGLQRRPAWEVHSRTEELASLLGISAELDKLPVENSGGQQQRAAVARALVTRPGLVLADEPTGSLDSKNARALMNALDALVRGGHATILLVTHDPLVASYCHRVVFIKDGRLFAELRRADDGRRNDSRTAFYRRIAEMLAALEGASS